MVDIAHRHIQKLRSVHTLWDYVIGISAFAALVCLARTSFQSGFKNLFEVRVALHSMVEQDILIQLLWLQVVGDIEDQTVSGVMPLHSSTQINCRFICSVQFHFACDQIVAESDLLCAVAKSLSE